MRQQRSREKGERIALGVADVRRAYFHSEARREIYVKLPHADYEEGMVGKLNKSMYGTRDAAQNWEFEYVAFMEGAGCRSGEASPCNFYNQERNLRAVVHGDDFDSLGYERDFNWLSNEIKKEIRDQSYQDWASSRRR